MNADTTPLPPCPAAAQPPRGTCPVHTTDTTTATTAKAPPAARPGPWPPGPPSGPTGWSWLWRMRRDMAGTLEGLQRDWGDLVHLRIVPEQVVLVMHPGLVRELLVQQHDRLIRAERPVEVFAGLHGQSVLVREGADWHAQRLALQPAFAPKAVKSLVPGLVATVRSQLQDWPTQHARWPVEQRLTQLTMAVILQAVFSSRLEPAALEAAEQAVQTVSRIAQGEFFWPASWPDAMPWKARKRHAMAVLRGLVENHLQDRLAQPEDSWPDDLLSRLMALHRAEPGRWTLRAVADECTTAFLAGHETVAASLTWWCWCLAADPQEQDRLAREVAQALAGADPGPQHLSALPRLRASLQESQRLYPAAPMLINRRATAPVTLGGRTLPARTLFMIPVQQLQRDARWYPQPGHFRPERFLQPDEQRPRGAWMPFGAGPRVCLGQHLAQDEMTVVAALLLQRWRLAPVPGAAAPQPEMAVTLRPRTPLHLSLQPA